MLYYFYNLYFEFEVGKDEGWIDAGYFAIKANGKKNIPLTKQYGIGYFSTRAKAEKQIQHHKNLLGFRYYPVDCFKIKKYGVKFDKKIEDKSLADLYVLSHEYYDGEYDYALILSPFSTKKEAMYEKKKLEKKKPFCDYLDGFVIDTCRVDRDVGWPEGFCTSELKDLED